MDIFEIVLIGLVCPLVLPICCLLNDDNNNNDKE